MTPRDVARRVLERVEREGAWATPALDGELARAGLDERDRRLAAELVYGVLRHRTRLDHILGVHADLKKTPARVLNTMRVAAYQILFLDRVPAYAAVDDAVAAARQVTGDKLAAFVNAVLRKLDSERDVKFPGWEVEFSLPTWIIDELKAAAPGRVPELAAAFAQSAPLVGRTNIRKTTRDALLAEVAGAVPLNVDGMTPAAFSFDGDPTKHASFLAGKWTVQDTGAQLVAHVAAPTAGQRILDACAGVGGKATHLAELTDDAAAIDAADLNATKLGLLAETAQRLGLSSIKRHACDLLDPSAPLGEYDLIVLDAPCSGLGVLRRHPDAKWRLTPADVPRLADLQRMLLDAVLKRLAPGGTLVYSVCTFTRAEGPDQVAALVGRTGLRLVMEHRSWPPGADAFYVAKLVRE